MAIERILVVDDEPLIRKLLKETFQKKGYEITLAENGLTALKEIKEHEFEMVITDVRMPGMDGIRLLEEIEQVSPSTLVVVITAYGSIENAVAAMKRGAYDYLTKPIDPERIELLIQKASQHRSLIQENRYLREEASQKYNFNQLIGKSPQMREVCQMIDRVAPSRSTVLIQGKTGTGKELVARAIHYRSSRRTQPFIKVNCVALPTDLLESELFGHEKGAFTGAINKKEGRFDLADKGTLLLDEVSETSPAFQVKLLRVLQEREFERVGGTRTINVDVRIIATTNKDLKKAMKEGHFREDLYYRLNVIPIYLAPLQERKEDIPLLAQHFLKKYSFQNGAKIKSISEKCLDLMISYGWPGNVRELENVIERAVVMVDHEVLLPEHLTSIYTLSTENSFFSGEISLEEMERRLIEETLRRVNFNRTKTADILGVSVRTIRNKIKKYNFS